MFRYYFFIVILIGLFFAGSFSLALKASEPNQQSVQAEQNKPKAVSGLSEEERAELETLGPSKWTETLKLRDFYLTPSFLDLKDKLKYKEHLASIYKESPNAFSTTVEYGLLLIDLGKLEEAKVVWGIAEKEIFGNDTPKVYKAWVNACKGNYLESKNVWYPIVKERLDFISGVDLWLPHQIDAFVGLTLIKDYLPPKDKEETEEIIQRFGRRLSSVPKLTAIYTLADLQAGKIKKATRRVENALSTNSNEPVLITLHGIIKLINGEYNEAKNLFDKSIEIYPNSPTAHLMKARALYALKNEKEAVIALEEAKAFDPSIKDLKAKKILAAKNYISPVEGKSKNTKEIKENVPENKEQG